MKLTPAAALMLVAGCVAPPTMAQESVGTSTSTAGVRPAEAPEDARDFGLVPSFYSAVDAYAMKPASSLVDYTHSPLGGIFCTNNSPERVFVGQIVVPHGVRMTIFRAWLYDQMDTERVVAVLEESCLPDFAGGLPSNRILGTVATTVAYNTFTGYSGLDALPVNTLADNQSCTLRVRATLGEGSCPPGLSNLLGFYKARIEWKRFIPPAPAQASFTDVPLNDPSFQVVEALKASGVTAGCTGTEFCPGQAVTRAQMAAFLARALGLPVQTLPDSANP